MVDNDEFQNLRLDYDQTQQTFRLLSDIRFKLLAFVPAVSAALITFLSSGSNREDGFDPALAAIVGSLGFFVTLGIGVYDFRNSELYAAVIHRGKLLETILELPPNHRAYEFGGHFRIPASEDHLPGGLFTQRGRSRVRLCGLPVKHDFGLALIYGTVLGAWTFPVVLGILTALHAPLAALAAALLAAAVGALSFRVPVNLDDPGSYVAGLGYPPGLGARSWNQEAASGAP